MPSVTAGAWLAWRKVSRRRADWALSIVCLVGVLVMTLLALATVTVPYVMARQADRSAAMTPKMDMRTGADPAKLRLIPPEVANSRRWEGSRIGRYFYARGSSSTVTAPGLPAMPDTGEFYASPDLIQLMDDNGTIRSLFDGLHLAGEIGQSGLIQPHELTAIIGVDPGTPLLANVDAFGTAAPVGVPQARQSDARLNGLVALFVTVTVWLPALVFVVIVSRLAAAQRRRRARVLRLVGLSDQAVRTQQAIEMGVVCLPGVAAATLIYLAFRGGITRLPGTDLGFFPSDGRLSWWAFAAAMVAPTLVISAVTALTLGSPGGETPSRASGGLSARLGGGGLIIGALLLLLAPWLPPAVGFLAVVGLWIGCALIAGGLALSGPSVVITAFRLAAESARSGGRLVGTRLAASTVSTSLRLGSMLAVVIVLLLGGGAFTNVLNGGSTQGWQDRLAGHPRVPTIVTDLIGGLSLQRVREAARDAPVVQQFEAQAGENRLNVVVADCSDLAALAGRQPRDCTGDLRWIAGAPELRGRDLSAMLPGGEGFRLPDASDVTAVANLPSSFEGSLLLPTRDAPESMGTAGSTFFTLPTNVSLMTTLARVSAASPTAQIDLGDLDRHNPDTQRFPRQIQWLTIGAVAGLALGALGLTAAAIGEGRERSLRLRALRILGAPNRELFYAHYWAAAAPLVLLGVVATLLGWLTVVALHTFDDRATYSTTSILVVGVSVMVVASAVALATWPSARRAAPQMGAVDA